VSTPGGVGASGDAAIYDLHIASTDDALHLEASTFVDMPSPASIEPVAPMAP
jgi:hypothetical protein